MIRFPKKKKKRKKRKKKKRKKNRRRSCETLSTYKGGEEEEEEEEEHRIVERGWLPLNWNLLERVSFREVGSGWLVPMRTAREEYFLHATLL